MGRRRGRRALSALRADVHERCERSRRPFQQIDEATFSYGTLENHLHVNAWECAQNSIAIATGGDTVQAAASGTSFPYDAAAPPTELVDFAAKVPCLQASATTDAVEACLAAPAPTAVPTAAAPSPSPSPTISPPDHVDCATLWDPVCGGDGTTYSNASGRRCWRRVRARCLCGDRALSFNMTSGAAPRRLLPRWPRPSRCWRREPDALHTWE